MKRKLKKSSIIGICSASFILILTLLASLKLSNQGNTDIKLDYVSKGILDYEQNVKVVNTKDAITRPYLDSDIKIAKNYYDYMSDAQAQENSLIFYKDTYMPSSGVSYSNGKEFDVVSILPGTVKEVKEDTTVGNSVTIEHENGIISVYQSISDIRVKEGDVVEQGMVIAKSATSNISSELDNHLYFELIISGVCVNPESYYDKLVSEI